MHAASELQETSKKSAGLHAEFCFVHCVLIPALLFVLLYVKIASIFLGKLQTQQSFYPERLYTTQQPTAN